jgi:DNA-binding NarL/FixJ family response regulator
MQISPDIVRQLVQERYSPPAGLPEVEEKTANKDEMDENSFEWLDSLTRREREIFTLLVLGYENEQIADKFDLALQTVRNQVSAIYSKLGVKNRFEIIRLANKNMN